MVWASQAWLGELFALFGLIVVFGVEDRGTLVGWKTDGQDLAFAVTEVEEYCAPSFTFFGEIFSPSTEDEF